VCKVPSEEDIRIKYEAEMLKVKQQYEAMFRAEQEARQRCVIKVGLVLLYPLLTHRGVWLCVQGGDGTEGVPPILWHGHQHRHPGMWLCGPRALNYSAESALTVTVTVTPCPDGS